MVSVILGISNKTELTQVFILLFTSISYLMPWNGLKLTAVIGEIQLRNSIQQLHVLVAQSGSQWCHLYKVAASQSEVVSHIHSWSQTICLYVFAAIFCLTTFVHPRLSEVKKPRDCSRYKLRGAPVSCFTALQVTCTSCVMALSFFSLRRRQNRLITNELLNSLPTVHLHHSSPLFLLSSVTVDRVGRCTRAGRVTPIPHVPSPLQTNVPSVSCSSYEHKISTHWFLPGRRPCVRG